MKIKSLFDSVLNGYLSKPRKTTLKMIKNADKMYGTATKQGIKIRKYKKFK